MTATVTSVLIQAFSIWVGLALAPPVILASSRFARASHAG
jgi:hypothetical protein